MTERAAHRAQEQEAIAQEALAELAIAKQALAALEKTTEDSDLEKAAEDNALKKMTEWSHYNFAYVKNRMVNIILLLVKL